MHRRGAQQSWRMGLSATGNNLFPYTYVLSVLLHGSLVAQCKLLCINSNSGTLLSELLYTRVAAASRSQAEHVHHTLQSFVASVPGDHPGPQAIARTSLLQPLARNHKRFGKLLVSFGGEGALVVGSVPRKGRVFEGVSPLGQACQASQRRKCSRFRK
jgi:hypothetical protein